MENDKSKINSFVDLLVWQKAHTMFNMVCDDVDTFPSKRVAGNYRSIIALSWFN